MINPKQTLVQKQWLICFLIYISVYVLCTSVEKLAESPPKLFELCYSLALFVIPSYITYHFSYKNRGTKWLLWLLSVALPLSMVRELPVIKNVFETESLMFTAVVILISLGTKIYYWIRCGFLRGENLRLKKSMQEAVPEIKTDYQNFVKSQKGENNVHIKSE